MFTALTTALILAPGAIQVQRVQVFDQIKFVAVAGAPTGSLFAVAQENGQVRLMNAATRSTVHQLVGHPQPAYGLAFTPNGQQLVTGDETSRIFVWDVRTGRKLREFPRGTMSHARGIQAISFSRDGRTMITTGKDDVVILWDFASARPQTRIAGNGVVFASATLFGSNMAVATLTEGLHFRRPGNFNLDVRRDGHGGQGINEMAINPAGTRAVTAGRDNAVGVWDLAKKSRLGSLRGHEDWVQRVAISPNGRVAASSANDRKVYVWDLVRMQRVGQLADQSAIGAPLAFTGDGRFLISGTINDGVQINSVTPAQPAATAPSRRRR